MKHLHLNVTTEQNYESEVSLCGDNEIDGLCRPSCFHEDEDIFKISTEARLIKTESRILIAMMQHFAIYNGTDEYLDANEFLRKLIPNTENHELENEKVLLAFNLFVLTTCDYLDLHQYTDSVYFYKYIK